MKDGDDGPVHILSLGAGVQSSAMALMAAQGLWEDMPALAVFADTQAESRRIYDWLDWIEKNLPYPVVRVTNGSLTEESLRIRQRKDGKGCWSKSLIPAFIQNRDGKRGIMGRACTADYKVKVIVKHAREQVIGKAGLQAWRARHREALREIRAHEAAKAALRRARKKKTRLGPEETRMAGAFPADAWKACQEDALVVQWIGISVDEAHRMKPSREPWIRNRWPLVEKRMSRHDCEKWMIDSKYPRPGRSACVYCPLHSDREWKRLRDEEPEEFLKAVQFDKDLRSIKAKTDNLRGVPYLHSSLKPLDQVDFDSEAGQGDLFGEECEGLCGI